MFDNFKIFLQRYISPELTGVYIDALQALHVLIGDGVVDFAYGFIEQFKETDKQTTIDYLQEEILSIQIETLKQYGVFINKEYTDNESVEYLTSILRTLGEIEHYEDLDTLYDKIEVGETSLESLLNVVYEITNIDYFPEDLILKLNDDIIINMKQVILSLIQERIDPMEDEEESSMRFHRNAFIGHKWHEHVDYTILATLAKQPGKLSLESILRLFGNKMADLKLPDAPYTWLYAVLWSSNGGDTVDYLYTLWDKYFLEERDKMAVKIALDNLNAILNNRDNNHD